MIIKLPVQFFLGEFYLRYEQKVFITLAGLSKIILRYVSL